MNPQTHTHVHTHTQTGWFDYKPSYWRRMQNSQDFIKWTELAGFPERFGDQSWSRSVFGGQRESEYSNIFFIHSLWPIWCLMVCFWKTLNSLFGQRWWAHDWCRWSSQMKKTRIHLGHDDSWQRSNGVQKVQWRMMKVQWWAEDPMTKDVRKVWWWRSDSLLFSWNRRRETEFLKLE